MEPLPLLGTIKISPRDSLEITMERSLEVSPPPDFTVSLLQLETPRV
jgi:hypothetical protein